MLEHEDAEGLALKLPWECCSYVVRPKTAGQRVTGHAREYRANMSSAPWFRKANRCFLFGRAQCEDDGWK